MTAPLIWMPTLDVRDQEPDGWLNRVVDRFLQCHHGRGHLITAKTGPWPSHETLKPEKGSAWYCARSRGAPTRSMPTSISLEMTVPTGLDDAVLKRLRAAQATPSPIRRVVVLRPPSASLDRIALALDTLSETVNVPLWLDVTTFGWLAASYLIAAHPDWQLSGVPDQEVWTLEELARQVDRPLVLDDFSGRSPRPVHPLPRFSPEKVPAGPTKRLPVDGGSG